MGAKGQEKKDHWYWKNEVSQARIKKVQEWLPVSIFTTFPSPFIPSSNLRGIRFILTIRYFQREYSSEEEGSRKSGVNFSCSDSYIEFLKGCIMALHWLIKFLCKQAKSAAMNHCKMPYQYALMRLSISHWYDILYGLMPSQERSWGETDWFVERGWTDSQNSSLNKDVKKPAFADLQTLNYPHDLLMSLLYLHCGACPWTLLPLCLPLSLPVRLAQDVLESCFAHYWKRLHPP